MLAKAHVTRTEIPWGEAALERGKPTRGSLITGTVDDGWTKVRTARLDPEGTRSLRSSSETDQAQAAKAEGDNLPGQLQSSREGG